ncbi:MAG TPA: flagellin [Candidatus Kapabacteria bacterium]|jgi:flagellin|nr:flagellin [Candidatus Kapabacteria bacterium]HPU23876.1 flagellin [Candidatus Kapabacteria bacterium]
MPSAISGDSRIRTNIPAENAYNALTASSNNIALRQLRLSTGKRINSAADDVSGYITSRALQARNGALKAALNSAGDAKNVTSIAQDALDQISSLVTQIKDAAATASSGALGTDEKVALAKGAYRLAQQIQFITDSTVFGGKQLLQGNFTGEWVTGYYANNQLMKISIDLTTSNPDFNVDGIFDLNATNEASAIRGTLTGAATSFAGVAGLNLEDLNEVSASNLGIFNNVGATSAITQTISSLAMAIDNINKVASYLGGIEVRINAQENVLKSQITNYKAAISRIEDADVATEQMELIKSQFLQQASLVSLAQANQNPQQFLQLFR